MKSSDKLVPVAFRVHKFFLKKKHKKSLFLKKETKIWMFRGK